MSIANIVSENRFGLATQLIIECNFCKQHNIVETSKKHTTGRRGPSAFDINSRAALACLHAGIGETHLDEICSTMDIPTMSRACYKIREREAGEAVETVAKKSCQEAISLEKAHCDECNVEPDENNLYPISCSYDMGWQKRGKGHNSKTGHGGVMGVHTGKVLDYATRTKSCRTCEYAAHHHHQPHTHDCRKNHTGSSKSMEPLAAVELFKNAPNYNIKYSTYTGDEDSTTELYIHQQVPYASEKFSDFIHIKRSLTSKLYNMAQSSKFVNCSSLSQKVID